MLRPRRLAARRKLLTQTQIVADEQIRRGWSEAIASRQDLSTRCLTYLPCAFARSRIVVMYLGHRPASESRRMSIDSAQRFARYGAAARRILILWDPASAIEFLGGRRDRLCGMSRHRPIFLVAALRGRPVESETPKPKQEGRSVLLSSRLISVSLVKLGSLIRDLCTLCTEQGREQRRAQHGGVHGGDRSSAGVCAGRAGGDTPSPLEVPPFANCCISTCFNTLRVKPKGL